MQLLNRLSISRKLTLFGAVTSVLALLLMAIALAMYDIRNIHQSVERYYGALAGVVGQSCSKAIENRRSSDALEGLKLIQKDPAILSAELRDADDRLFLEFASDPVEGMTGAPGSLLFGSEQLIVSRPIEGSSGAIVGQVRLRVTADRLWAEAQEHMLLIIGVTLAGIMISALLAGYLQRQISGPLLHLVQTARAISDTGDYSRRAHRHTFDEFGQLCEEFNN